MHWARRVLSVVAILLFVSSPAVAASYYVPDNFATIQAALDAATTDDVIIVRDGVYTGAGNKNLDFKGKALTLEAENGAEACIIDCQGSGRGFYFHSGEGLDSVVDGFTVINGNAGIFSLYYYGGGIYCRSSSPTIQNCTIANNTAHFISGSWSVGKGGGIHCEGSSAKFENCKITGNSADFGGGFHIFSDSNVIINDCLISENSATAKTGGIECGYSSITLTNCTISKNVHISNYSGAGGIELSYSTGVIDKCLISENSTTDDGGGIQCTYSSPVINSCIFEGNTAGSGGGMHCRWSSPAITNCTFRDNSAGYGGGIVCYQESSPFFTNCFIYSNHADVNGGGIICSNSGSSIQSSPSITFCTIANNSADGDPFSMGGGIYVYNSQPSITNSILWNNLATYAGPDVALHLSSSLNVSYCDIAGGKSAVYVFSGSTLNWGTGNQNADPLFAGIENLHLKSGSPCINSGAVASVYVDIDGDARPQGGGYDIGADEYMLSVSLDVIPTSTTVSQGGKLRYTAAVVNLTDSPITFQYWTIVNLPNGSTYPVSGALFGPVPVTLAAFENRPPVELAHTIPWTAPSGTYTYNAYIGTYPSTIINEDHFKFTVRW